MFWLHINRSNQFPLKAVSSCLTFIHKGTSILPPPSNPHVLRQTHATHFPHRVCISGSSDPSNRPSDSLTRRRGHSSTAACHASPSCQNTTGTLHIRRWCGLVISVTLVRQMGYLATCHKLCPKGLQAGLSSEKGEHGRTKLEVSRL